MAEDIGLPIGDLKIIANSRLALVFGEYARERGKHESYHRAVLHAYWADGENIGERDVLESILAEVGLNVSPQDMARHSQRWSNVVDDTLGEARRSGIHAIPAFVMGSERIVGAEPYDVIRSMVERVMSENRGRYSAERAK